MKKAPAERLWELDFARGIAILLMVAFHLAFDLSYFFNAEGLSTTHGFWYFEGRLAAILFMGLAGISSGLLGIRRGAQAWRKNLNRSLRLIGLGAAITIATWFFDSERTIWFGILHFLGVSILLSTFFLRFKWLNVGLGILIIGLGGTVSALRLDHFWGLPLGIRPLFFQSFDYYPLIPWFGVVLIGIALGNFLYKSKKPLFARPMYPPEKTITWMGRHSLWIYLAHQPILLGLLSILLS